MEEKDLPKSENKDLGLAVTKSRLEFLVEFWDVNQQELISHQLDREHTLRMLLAIKGKEGTGQMVHEMKKALKKYDFLMAQKVTAINILEDMIAEEKGIKPKWAPTSTERDEAENPDDETPVPTATPEEKGEGTKSLEEFEDFKKGKKEGDEPAPVKA